jgi:hypothetical protein
MDIVITQMQDYLFTFPLELQIEDKSGSRIEKVNIAGKETRLVIKASPDLKIVSDPDVKLLFRVVAENSTPNIH